MAAIISSRTAVIITFIRKIRLIVCFSIITIIYLVILYSKHHIIRQLALQNIKRPVICTIMLISPCPYCHFRHPQRQENADVAAVVARGGGPRWPGKHLSQGSAGSGASTTAGKCRIRCRCGMGRRTGAPQRAGNRSGRKGWRTEEIWNGGTSCSFLPKGLRRPHPRNLPYGDERSQNIHQEHSSRHDSSDHKYGQRP